MKKLFALMFVACVVGLAMSATAEARIFGRRRGGGCGPGGCSTPASQCAGGACNLQVPAPPAPSAASAASSVSSLDVPAFAPVERPIVKSKGEYANRKLKARAGRHNFDVPAPEGQSADSPEFVVKR